jgi:hypothetical protein
VCHRSMFCGSKVVRGETIIIRLEDAIDLLPTRSYRRRRLRWNWWSLRCLICSIIWGLLVRRNWNKLHLIFSPLVYCFFFLRNEVMWFLMNLWWNLMLDFSVLNLKSLKIFAGITAGKSTHIQLENVPKITIHNLKP